MSQNPQKFLDSENQQYAQSKLINSQLVNQHKNYHHQQQKITQNNNEDNPNQNQNKYTNFIQTQSYTVKKSKVQKQIQQLQNKLYHQIIIKSQFPSQNDFQKQVIHKVSQPVKQKITELLNQIAYIQQKLENPLLNHFQKQQIKQKILQHRMQELSNTRVLVSIYRHHQYRLVITSFHIAQTYYQLKCYQQAINHMEIAIQLNGHYKQTSKDALYYETFLLTHLAYAQFNQQLYQASLSSLNQAIQIQEKLTQDNYKVNDFDTLNLMAKVLTQNQKHSDAISYAKMALQSAQNICGKQSIQYANGYRTLAQVQANAQKWNQSIQHLKIAIQLIQTSSTQKQQTIIDFYSKLAQITLRKLSNSPNKQSKSHYDQYIQVLKKKYQMIQNTYGYRDKRSIKQKRFLASTYLKYLKIQQAEEELEDILEIQEIVYGEKSVEVGKTLKLLGTVAMSQNQIKKAEKHLKKSLSIFHDQGYASLQKQVQAKILVLTGKGKYLGNN